MTEQNEVNSAMIPENKDYWNLLRRVLPAQYCTANDRNVSAKKKRYQRSVVFRKLFTYAYHLKALHAVTAKCNYYVGATF